MQRLQESENGAILEYIANQELTKKHYALSAEDLGVRERLRRILLNWAVHFPVRGSLEEEWGREEGRWEVGGGKVWMKVTKRDGGRILRGCTGEDVPKGTVGDTWGTVWLKVSIKRTAGGA